MDHAIEILLAVNTGLVSVGLWLLYKILTDMNHIKVFAGITKVRMQSMEYRLQRIEGHK